MKKAVIVLSGGMDSVTAMYFARSKGYQVYAITFYYGQRHKKEIVCARRICKKLNVHHEIVDLSDLGKVINNSSLTGNIELPEGHYQDKNMRLTVVPNRNMILFSVAVGYAVNISAESVFVGIHSGDHPIYPDCRPDFLRLFNITCRSANRGFIPKNFRIIAPFLKLTKDKIVQKGIGLGVPFGMTWSCYKGKKYHCGKCGTCNERKEAFRLSGVPDPTVYE